MDRHSPAAEALTDLILEVFRLNGRLLAAGDRLTRPTGQTSARWQVLGVGSGPLPVAAIARIMGLARQSVQRTADLLQEEGLVEFAENPAHRRSKLVRLTPLGCRVLKDITRRQIAWTNDLADRLHVDEREIRHALNILRRFREEVETGERRASSREGQADHRSRRQRSGRSLRGLSGTKPSRRGARQTRGGTS